MSDETRSGRVGSVDAGEDERDLAELLALAGKRPELPADDLTAVRAAVRESMRARTPLPARSATVTPFAPRRRNWVAAAALAAALVAAIGIAWWSAKRPHRGPAMTVASVEVVRGGARLVMPDGQVRALARGISLPAGCEVRTAGGEDAGFAGLRLGGGGSLRLDAGSRVRLIEPTIVALEEGAVYADSRADGAKVGIVVRTPLGEVREVGTQFVVRLEGERRALRVRVREGSVVAEVGGGEHQAQAGEELIVDAQGHAARRAVAASGPDWEWVVASAPRFAGEGRTVRDLLEWTARETGWHLRYEDDAAQAASSTVLHGDLGSLSPDRAPFAVLPGAGLEAALRDGTLVVRTAR